MRQFIAAFVVVVVLGAAAFLVWRSTDSGGTATASNAGSAAANSPTGGAPQKPDELAVAAPSADDERATIHESRPGDAPLDPSKSRALRGRVQSDGPFASDEVLEVFALKSEAERSKFEGLIDGESDRELVARATVDASGAFELRVPLELGECYLFAFGRYASSTATTRVVAAKSAESAIVLPVVSGTWVRGTLDLPPNADAPAALAESLQGLEIRLDGDDGPNFGAGARMGRGSSNESRSAHSSDGKTFEVRSMLGSHFVRAFARPEGKSDAQPLLAAAKSARFDIAPNAQRTVSIAFARGGALAGVLVDEVGAPVAGASLEVTFDAAMMGMGGSVARKGTTAADGTFELAAVRAGKSHMSAKRDGFLDENFEVEVADGQRRDNLRFVLTRGASVAGTVLWPDKTPVESANVSVEFDLSALTGMNAMNAMRGAKGSSVTSADGRFLIAGLGAGPFTLRASAPPKGSKAEGTDKKLFWRASHNSIAPGTKDLELVLGAPEGIQGRVVDETGAPVAKFSVLANQKVASFIPGLGGSQERQEFEDADGRFVFGGLDRGDWNFTAVAEGFGESETLTSAVPLPEGTPELDLTLAHVGRISGRVVDWKGAPAPKATVGRHLGMQDFARMANPARRPLQTTTDAQGEFVLENVTPGHVDLVAKDDANAESEPVPVDVAPKESKEGIVLRMRQGGTLTGEVYGADGKPLASVRILTQMPINPISQRFAESDAKGHFEFQHLEPGTWQVIYMPWLSRDGESPSGDMSKLMQDMKLASADVKDGEETHIVIGAPPANPVRVHGRVTAGGVPAKGAAMNFVPDGAKPMNGLKAAAIDASGRYEIKLDQAGRYLATVQKIGTAGEQQSVEMSVKIPEVEEYALDIELPLGSITGRVFDGDDKPAVKTRVSLTPSGAIATGTFFGGRYSEITTDSEGNFTLEWLKPGDYVVAAGGAMFGGLFGDAHPLGREIKNVSLKEGERLEHFDFRLKASGSVKGLVKDHAGNPVPNAGIFLRDAQERLVERLSLVATDSNGRFSYAGLAEGSYSVSARSASDATSAPVSVHVRGGETAEALVELDAGTTLIVSTVDEQDQPLDADLLVVDDKGRQVNGVWTLGELMNMVTQSGFSSKEQHIGPLPAGKYRVTATAADGRTDSKPVTLSGQAERHVKLKLKS